MKYLPVSIATCALVLSLAVSIRSFAEETPAAKPAAPMSPMLTIERLFGGAGEFNGDSLKPIRWSKRSASYFTLETPQEGKGRDLVKVDQATGAKEVIVPAAALVPEKSKEPLNVDAFDFSEDESRLLIFTNSRRAWRRNTRGDYWIFERANRSLKKLGGDAPAASLMFAKFSPDGSRVAFVRDNNLYIQEIAGLGITALTKDGSARLINGTSDWVNEEELNLRDCFRFSPDGRQLLFWQFDTSGVREFQMINNTDDKYPRLITFAYPKVGEKNSATRLGVISSGGGEVRWLQLPGDPREHYLPHAEWTPDGSQILVQQFNRLQTENRVFLADPKSGEARSILTESDAAWLENDNPVRWLDGGRQLLWISERSGWRHAYVAALDGGNLTPITQGKYDLIDVEAIDPAGTWLYFAASSDNATQRYLYRVSLKGGEPQRLSPAGQSGWHTYNISPDANWAIHTFSNFTTPPIVELVRLSDHTVVRTLIDNKPLSDRLAALKRPAIEFMKVEIGNGITLDGWSLMPPPTADATREETPVKKRPLLVHVYGEPHGQTVKDAWGGPRGLWHWMMAQQGCVVVSVDNRGTNVPRGRDWRKCVHRKIGIIAPQEQAEAVKSLLKRWSFVDESRVGIWGWSGGGSMSLNAIFRYPDLYRTAVAIAPVPNQLLYDTIYQERYMGLPKDNANGYRDGSPLSYAHRLRGNLLLVHGTGDDNCHYQGTELLMDELIARGKYFTSMPYPNRSHSISEGPHVARHLWGMMTRYFQENLIDEHAPAITQLPPFDIRTVRGWTLNINRELLVTEPTLTERAVELLDKQLEEITRVVPAAAVIELKKVPLYFNPEYPNKRPSAEFHPDAGWLRSNGRDPVMAKGVEFTNVRNFEQETNRMPNFVLHELAHAYHFRVLDGGFGNSKVKAAFERAKNGGRYEKVERHFGNGRPNSTERAYALSNPMEYFAETTEAYFSRNDFFPFNRDELKQHDPEMLDLLKELWGAP